ncbi:4Fe-4S binding protein [Clostridium sp. AM58-1XD]|uniref:4Fe-4S binding protein n=1 Tax=Clostridium sp. AM58-1XD TaxID=2292307 RepID=UPI000E46CBE8|nr:4Fe-4S binding protein [Clostridium sp. AM58-1XD]RGY96751.1 4Fe-4S dicluster domain-containing protein [Clostridium sp. AM58-1XD]
MNRLVQNQNTDIRKKSRASVDKTGCVACGCCVKYCPREAIRVVSGIYAEVDTDRCVGCGLCARACPASTISIYTVSSANGGSTAADQEGKMDEK